MEPSIQTPIATGLAAPRLRRAGLPVGVHGRQPVVQPSLHVAAEAGGISMTMLSSPDRMRRSSSS